jgi:drug/metabolite transporter (DMT)-like permease
MTSWYVLSIVALILMGTQRFLYKVSAERRCHTAWTTFSFMATVALLSSGAFVLSGEALENRGALALVAAVNSGSFFHDHISIYQFFGIGTAIGVILVLTREAEEHKGSARSVKKGLMLVFVSVISGAISSISSKFAAMYVNKFGFMALAYAMGMIFSLGMVNRLGGKEVGTNHKEAFLIGFVMGLINFAGFYLFLKALSLGPLSIIVSVTGMHFVIAIFLSVLLYGEKMNLPRILGIGLAVLSIVLLRL